MYVVCHRTSRGLNPWRGYVGRVTLFSEESEARWFAKTIMDHDPTVRGLCVREAALTVDLSEEDG